MGQIQTTRSQIALELGHASAHERDSGGGSALVVAEDAESDSWSLAVCQGSSSGGGNKDDGAATAGCTVGMGCAWKG